MINSDLIIEAKNIPEIVSLMELYPNIVECFKIVTDLLIYNKLAYFISNNRVGINPILLFKPNIKDDIYLIKKYFDETIEIYNMEKVYPLIIKEKFFLEYYKCFEKEDEDFNKNLIIIEMLDLYISKIPNKINTTEILNMHYKKGISLLKNNKLKNESFIKFIQSFRNIKDKEEIIKYFPNAIEFNENNKDNNDFIKNILNEDSYDLKDFLGYKYDEVFNKIFDKFVLPKDLTCIRYWELDTNTPENIIYIAMKTIKRVWINNPENHMYGMDVLFTSIFSRASLCIENYMDIILELEKKISEVKLMIIYSNILIKNCEVNYQFKEHMRNFISSNKNETALYLWFLLSTYIDRNRRIELLKNNLKINFAVKYDDFIDYPKKLNDRINLFTKLKKNEFIPGDFADSEYYKYSMDSKNYLEKNIFKNALIIDNNINKIYELLINFFADNDEDASQIGIKITIFRDKVEIANRYYDSLKTIKKFWDTFFPDVYKDKLTDIMKQIDKFEGTKLEQAAKAKNLNKDILAKAEEGKEFIDSIFFMEIYNRLKKEIKDEFELFEKSVENFKMLEKLGENNDLELLDDDLKRDIINAYNKEKDSLKGELNFINKYFKFDKSEKYKNFNIDSIINNIKNIQILVKNNKEEGLLDNNNSPSIFYGNKIKFLHDEILYNSIIFTDANKNILSKLLINFYEELIDFEKNSEQIPQKEKCIDIIPILEKLLYLENNLNIINYNTNDNDILLLKQFKFVIDIIKYLNKNSKDNYIKTFKVFKQLLDDNKQNNYDQGDLGSLLIHLQSFLPKRNDNSHIYIEIFLIYLNMKMGERQKKSDLLKYILNYKFKNNIQLNEDMFPILDNILSKEII